MRFLLLFFMLFVFTTDVCAQMIDMRAYSRQRGFRAYQPVVERPRIVVPVPVVDQKADLPPENEEKDSVLPAADKTEKTDGKIRQTGINVFQKKDEDKVLNVDVSNPEFDKLRDSRKKDVMSRIKIEKEGVN